MTMKNKAIKAKQEFNRKKQICDKYSINNAVKFLKEEFGMSKADARAFYEEHAI